MEDGMLDLLVQQLKTAQIFGVEEAAETAAAAAEVQAADVQNARSGSNTGTDAKQLEKLHKAIRRQAYAVTAEGQADADARMYANDLMNEGCTSVQLLMSLVWINQVGSGEEGLSEASGYGSIYAATASVKKALTVISKARYPFGPELNLDYPNRPKVEPGSLNKLFEDNLSGLRQRPRPDQMEPEPEPEPERHLLTPPSSATTVSGFGGEMAAERERCIRMLKVLADMLDDKYSEGGQRCGSSI